MKRVGFEAVAYFVWSRNMLKCKSVSQQYLTGDHVSTPSWQHIYITISLWTLCHHILHCQENVSNSQNQLQKCSWSWQVPGSVRHHPLWQQEIQVQTVAKHILEHLLTGLGFKKNILVRFCVKETPWRRNKFKESY